MIFLLKKDKKQMGVIVSYLRQLSKDCVVEVAQRHWVACKSQNGKWKVFMYERPDGCFEGTLEEKTIELCLWCGLSKDCYIPKEIQERFTGEYKIINLKDGDKCEDDKPEMSDDELLAEVRRRGLGRSGKIIK